MGKSCKMVKETHNKYIQVDSEKYKVHWRMKEEEVTLD
jgi:hypothetical protein